MALLTLRRRRIPAATAAVIIGRSKISSSSTDIQKERHLSMCDYLRELGINLSSTTVCQRQNGRGEKNIGSNNRLKLVVSKAEEEYEEEQQSQQQRKQHGKSGHKKMIRIMPKGRNHIKSEEKEDEDRQQVETGLLGRGEHMGEEHGEFDAGEGAAAVDSTSAIVEFDFQSIGKYPSCQGHFESCHLSKKCTSSGFACRNPQTEEKCCKRRSDPQCPSTERLGYTCLQRNPVNWCNQNSDCATNMLRSHICCPTGCGYNVCVSNVQNSPPSRRIMLIEKKIRNLSPDCPNPFLIRIRCVVPKPTSWCHSAKECPTYDRKFPRRCCLTPCGYNVCLTKFDQGWIIA